MLQQFVAQAIEHLFETEFTEHSYGFRPIKNAQQSLHKAQSHINKGYEPIVDKNLKNFFDEVEYCLLLNCSTRR